MNKLEQMSAVGRGGETAFGLHSNRRMHFIRLFEQRRMNLSAAKAIAGSIHLCAGQEALPVGAAAALKSDPGPAGLSFTVKKVAEQEAV